MVSGQKPEILDGRAGSAASSTGFTTGVVFDTPGMCGSCGLNASVFPSLSGIVGLSGRDDPD
jgi:hypothetical protein